MEIKEIYRQTPNKILWIDFFHQALEHRKANYTLFWDTHPHQTRHIGSLILLMISWLLSRLVYHTKSRRETGHISENKNKHLDANVHNQH